MNNKQEFILASKSPRREEILKKMNVKFSVSKIDIDENNDIKNPFKKVVYLSKLKSKYYKGVLEKKILITADTIVHKKIILEKPKTKNESFEMLKYISNKKHYVTTGVTLRSINKKLSFYETSEVYFKKLSTQEINYYIKNFQTKDKAGGYGIQEWIGLIGVKKINGCFYNIMGFPANKFYQKLKFFKH